MSRREQIRMTPEEVRDFLDVSRTIILCSNDPDGAPHPMPMWFAVDDEGAVCMTTFAKSHKVANLRQDPAISLLAEDGEQYQELRGVVLYGDADIDEDPEVVLDTLAAVTARYAGMDTPMDDTMREGLRATAAKRVRLRVAPQRVVSWDHRKLGGVY